MRYRENKNPPALDADDWMSVDLAKHMPADATVKLADGRTITKDDLLEVEAGRPLTVAPKR